MSDTNTLNDLLPDSLNQEEQPNTQQPSLTKDDEILDMSGGFDFDDYQVVRREFFAHIKEPSVTFNECKLYVNAACLSKFPNASYAQVLINQKKKILALRPCEEGARDSFMWCNSSTAVSKPARFRQVFGKRDYLLFDFILAYHYSFDCRHTPKHSDCLHSRFIQPVPAVVYIHSEPNEQIVYRRFFDFPFAPV